MPTSGQSSFSQDTIICRRIENPKRQIAKLKQKSIIKNAISKPDCVGLIVANWIFEFV
jgi:hypothetical protein